MFQKNILILLLYDISITIKKFKIIVKIYNNYHIYKVKFTHRFSIVHL